MSIAEVTALATGGLALGISLLAVWLDYRIIRESTHHHGLIRELHHHHLGHHSKQVKACLTDVQQRSADAGDVEPTAGAFIRAWDLENALMQQQIEKEREHMHHQDWARLADRQADLARLERSQRQQDDGGEA